MRGGYKIIDLKSLPLTSGQEAGIDGLFKKLENPYNKATMISGLVVGDIPYPDFYVPFIKNGNNMVGNVVISGASISMVCTPDDNFTVTVG